MAKRQQKRLGIIQSRGLGDLIIALPIAHYYHEQGWHVHWPIMEQWVEQMSGVAPWVKWIPVPLDSGAFFYDVPMQRLQNFKCDEILCLYQALSGHPEFTQEPWFQHTSFDQYKYLKAGVPFRNKWLLRDCITRDPDREQALRDRVVTNSKYVVTHLNSSHQTVRYDPAIIPDDWQVIPVTDDGWIFDWLSVIEGAEAVIMTDSVMSNLVDQLDLDVEKYYIPQNHIQLTPVHLCDWTWLDNPDLAPGIRIFGSK
jgi:hypothetical protein